MLTSSRVIRLKMFPSGVTIKLVEMSARNYRLQVELNGKTQSMSFFNEKNVGMMQPVWSSHS